MSRFALFPALALAAGCVPGLADDFEDDLTRRGGCADVKFFAVDADDATMLSLWTEDLVAEATAAAETRTTVFDLPDAAVELIVEQGRKVSDATCDDVIENGGPVVDATWTATSGKATITIVPGETEWDARGTLLLEDVVFEHEGDAATVEELEIADTSVGWLAG